MRRRIALPVVALIAVIAFAAGAGAGIAGWLWFWGGNDTPSQTVENVAPQLSLGGSSATTNAPASSGGVTNAPQLSLGDSTPEATPAETGFVGRFAKPIAPVFQQQVEATPEVTPEATPEPALITITRGLYRINAETSLVSFILQEDLRGQRIDVIGTTNQVGGDMIVDFSAPSASEVGQIIVNARTLETDNTFRNQAIRSEILKSGQDTYEFITFTPTSLSGLDGLSVMTNTPITAQITGDLTMVDTTLPVTFDMVLTVADDLSLSGTASVVARWADFGLNIPSVPGVSNITDDVTLQLEFVADLIESEGGTDTVALDYSRGLFRIDPTQSEVSFTLQEDLRGQRVDVVGITSEVGGDIIVNAVYPSESQVGQIVINARTLATDNNFRNQAIRSEVLKSGQDAYEFITFTPTSITGLESVDVAVGLPIPFQLTGDLTIVDVTRSVTFEVEAVLTDSQTLTGTASVVVLWSDFGLNIPGAPGIANITDEVTLAITFVAPLVQSE